MYSPERSPSESPLSIASMFRRQAAALGVSASPRQPLAPLAPYERGSVTPNTSSAETVADFVQDRYLSEPAESTRATQV